MSYVFRCRILNLVFWMWSYIKVFVREFQIIFCRVRKGTFRVKIRFLKFLEKCFFFSIRLSINYVFLFFLNSFRWFVEFFGCRLNIQDKGIFLIDGKRMDSERFFSFLSFWNVKIVMYREDRFLGEFVIIGIVMV